MPIAIRPQREAAHRRSEAVHRQLRLRPALRVGLERLLFDIGYIGIRKSADIEVRAIDLQESAIVLHERSRRLILLREERCGQDEASKK